MIKNKATEKACSDCWGLRNGTRSNQDPHEYLVPSGSVGSDNSASYRCLLCKIELTCRVEGLLTHWR